jgi:hypothetical protein
MTDRLYEKFLRSPTFDGKEDKFQIFWMRFKAYVKVYKFAPALKICGEANLPANDVTPFDIMTVTGRLQAVAKKRNDWPVGLAHLIVAAMLQRYMSQDTVTRVELRQMLNKVSMTPNNDPRVIFEQISTIKKRYKMVTQRIEIEDLIAVVLDAAAKD